MTVESASRGSTIEAVRALEVLENTSDAVVLVDFNWRCLYVNARAEALGGMPRDKLLGQVLWELFPEANGSGRSELARAMRDRVSSRFEEYYEPYDLYAEVNAYPTPEGLAMLIRNITGQKRAEQSLRREIGERKRTEREMESLLAREQKARETAEMLNSVGPILLAERDQEKLVQAVIGIATRAVGAEVGCYFPPRRQEEVLYASAGPRAEEFVTGDAEKDLFASALRGGKRYTDLASEVVNGPNFSTPSGPIPVRSCLAVPIVSRHCDVLGGLFFGHSEPGRFGEQHESIILGLAAQAAIALDNARLFEHSEWAQSELKRSNEDLRRANKDLETFAYSASHDLQEPLRNVSLSAQLLERALKNVEVPPDTAGFLDGILNGAQRMENLVRDLLAYARATQYKQSPASPADSNGTLAGVLLNLKARIEQSGAEITSDDLPVVRVHQVHLAQLLQNLISNALKYRGKEKARVHVAAKRRDGWWVFSVEDNGIGIEPRYHDQIFGLFKRLHTRDEYPGSGIGLAICQRIVEQYGGRIWLERSAPGQGSVFCFSLPEG